MDAYGILDLKSFNQDFDLKAFDSDGYVFNEDFSTEKSLVFTRMS